MRLSHRQAAPAPPPRDGVRNLGELLLPPTWLTNLGRSAWLIVGIVLLTVAAVYLLALTHAIVMPVLAAAVVAAVTSPIVAWLYRHRVRRGVGAALVLVGIAVLTIGLVLLVVGGVVSQIDSINREVGAAK